MKINLGYQVLIGDLQAISNERASWLRLASRLLRSLPLLFVLWINLTFSNFNQVHSKQNKVSSLKINKKSTHENMRRDKKIYLSRCIAIFVVPCF